MTTYPAWADDALMKDYYDHYWGQPSKSDQWLFEMLSLELFQAGLTWKTIWKRRTDFEKAFADFEIDKVAAFDAEQIAELTQDKRIIRNRRKIEATVNNAKLIQSWHQAGKTLSDFLWSYVEGQPRKMHFANGAELPAKDDLSQKISKDMKKAGFRFVGPTIIFSYLCAVGIYQLTVDNW